MELGSRVLDFEAWPRSKAEFESLVAELGVSSWLFKYGGTDVLDFDQ